MNNDKKTGTFDQIGKLENKKQVQLKSRLDKREEQNVFIQ